MKTTERIPKNPHRENPFSNTVMALAAGLFILIGAGMSLASLGGGMVLGFGCFLGLIAALGEVVAQQRRAHWELRCIHALLEEQTEHLCGDGEPPVKE